MLRKIYPVLIFLILATTLLVFPQEVSAKVIKVNQDRIIQGIILIRTGDTYAINKGVKLEINGLILNFGEIKNNGFIYVNPGGIIRNQNKLINEGQGIFQIHFGGILF
ncbi:MAG: hypothetical protein JSV96_13865 [Candidatus Aminicenantes bacterium]|nr:MAG: hypothetical protein JSV96_13865 [Candidatus Aminicenantes bacterium]